MLRMVFLSAWLAAGSSLALAQDPADAPAVSDESEQVEEEARAHFVLGQAAYDGARYEEALSEFERAYELSGRVELQYNIGLANERLLRWGATITAFEAYLEAVPEALNAVNVRARIRVATERLEAEAQNEQDEVDNSVPAPTPSAVGPILTLAGGAVIAGVGGALLGIGASTLSDAEASPMGTQWSEVSGDVDRGNTLRTVGIIGLGVGVAVLVAGIVWLVTRKSGGTQSAAILSQAVVW